MPDFQTRQSQKLQRFHHPHSAAAKLRVRLGSFSMEGNHTDDSMLIALEIDFAVGLFVPAADETRRNPASVEERPPVLGLLKAVSPEPCW